MFFKYSRTVIRTETRQTGKLKNPLNKMISGNKAVPEVIRTPDLPLRRRSLYPAELLEHDRNGARFVGTCLRKFTFKNMLILECVKS